MREPTIVVVEFPSDPRKTKLLFWWMIGSIPHDRRRKLVYDICYVSHLEKDREEEKLLLETFAFATRLTVNNPAVLHVWETGWEQKDWKEVLEKQDLIFFGGGAGNVLLENLRQHSTKDFFYQLWQKGTVLGGSSAGAFPWFAQSLNREGHNYAPLREQPYGFLPYSYCPHAVSDPMRLPEFRRCVQEEKLPSGYALQNGTGLLFQKGIVVKSVRVDDEAKIFFVEKNGQQAERSVVNGSVKEVPTLLLDYLGNPISA